MKTWHPKTWSQQARALCDRIVNNVEDGYWTIEQGMFWFSTSYRHPLIVNRAAKRYGRLMRAGKIHYNKRGLAGTLTY